MMVKATPEFLERVYALEGPEAAAKLYDEWAATYDATLLAEPHYTSELILEAMNGLDAAKDARIMDLGCGTGLVAEALVEASYGKPDGLDLSQGMLEEARKKKVYGELIQADLLAPPTPVGDRLYDYAVSAGVFTHTHVGPTALRECVRMVKPGGYCVLLVKADFFQSARFLSAVEELEGDGLVLLESARLTPYRRDLTGRMLILSVL